MPSINVLIVDDSAVMRKILERSLRQSHVVIGAVYEAADGAEALEKLKENSAVQVIFSDVNMPNMDGLEFLRQLRALEKRKGVPVVMVTTEGTESKVMEALGLGAAGYIRKPFTAEQMQETLTKLFP